MSQMKLHVLYLPSEIVSGAYFHRRGLSFAMMYFLNYTHLSIWSFYRACNVLLVVDKIKRKTPVGLTRSNILTMAFITEK